jgi:hypothetical protein
LKQGLTALLAISATAALAAPAEAASCRIPAAHVIARGKVAKLLSVPTPDGAALYACIRRSGRKVALDIGFANARLSGRWVAWQRHAGGKWRIDVHDLRTGRERLIDGHAADRALLLTTTGTAVWAQRFDTEVGIYANDLRTGGHLLGRGEIQPSTLRLRGRRVSWKAADGDYTADVR